VLRRAMQDNRNSHRADTEVGLRLMESPPIGSNPKTC
jgi:hypothetical protein